MKEARILYDGLSRRQNRWSNFQFYHYSKWLNEELYSYRRSLNGSCDARCDRWQNLTTFSDGQCTRDLIELRYQNPRLEAVEHVFIESHLALIRTAYDGWKRRNTTSWQ